MHARFDCRLRSPIEPSGRHTLSNSGVKVTDSDAGRSLGIRCAATDGSSPGAHGQYWPASRALEIVGVISRSRQHQMSEVVFIRSRFGIRHRIVGPQLGSHSSILGAPTPAGSSPLSSAQRCGAEGRSRRRGAAPRGADPRDLVLSVDAGRAPGLGPVFARGVLQGDEKFQVAQHPREPILRLRRQILAHAPIRPKDSAV